MSSLVTLKSSDLNHLLREQQQQQQSQQPICQQQLQAASSSDDADFADQFLDLWRGLWSKRDTAWHLDNPVHP